MREYDTWSFRDRTFAIAIILSIAWHLFWFFLITIVVAPPKKQYHPPPHIVSLGPVLDDTILRTLVQAKVETTPAFYRQLSDFVSVSDIPIQTMQRYSPGDVVSVPLSRKIFDSLKDLVGGRKVSPDNEFLSRVRTRYLEEAFEIEGDIQDRPLINRPEAPDLPPGSGPVVIDFSVNASGDVVAAEIELSSGNVEADELWKNYVKGWQFSSSAVQKAGLTEKGKVRFAMNSQDKG